MYDGRKGRHGDGYPGPKALGSIGDDRPDRSSRMHEVEALVDPIEGQNVRNKIVDVYLVLHVPIDNLRHVGATPGTAECGPFPDAAGYQLERAGMDLLPCTGNADDDRYTPAAMATLERLAHQLHVADALETVVGTTLGQLHEVSHDVAPHLLGIDEVRQAELARKRLARRVDVDAHDHVGAGHPGTLDYVEPNSSKAEHHDIRSRLDLGRIDHRPDTRGHSAADVADLFERRVFPDLGHGDFRQHREVREGRASHVVIQRLAVERKAAGSVGHHALALRRPNSRAEIGLA